MEDRRKIVVPIVGEPEAPHFDAEETLMSARPVVPLAPGKTTQAMSVERATQRSVPFHKRLTFMALIVVAAIGMGLLGGLAIARYQYAQQRAVAPVAAAPAPPVNNIDSRSATVQTTEEPKQEAPSVQEVKAEEKNTDQTDETTASENSDKKSAPEASTKTTDDDSTDKPAGDKKEDKIKTAPSTTRDRTRDTDDEQDTDAPRAQRRERRQRDRNSDGVTDLPRQVERAEEQINRIREIFEGRQQRP